MYRAARFLVFLALSGCAQVQLEHQTDSFNRATANAIGEHTLLNAVRSSLDMPMSFTKLLKFTASNMASGALAPRLPFGGDAQRIFDLGPTLNWSGGVGQIEYADANSSGPLAKLNETFRYDAVQRYVDQGFYPGLLMTVLVEHVEIHNDLLAKIHQQRKRVCLNPVPSLKPACAELVSWTRDCKWPEHIFEGSFTLPSGYRVTAVGSRGTTRCEFLLFHAFRYYLALSGYWAELEEAIAAGDQPPKASEGKAKKSAEGTPSKPPQRSAKQVIRFEVPEVQREYDRIENEFKRKAGKNGIPRQAIYIRLRSARSLLSYLGELIALQNFSDNRYVPKLITPDGKSMTLFKVVRGSAVGQAALTVRGPDGEFYSVLRPEYGSETRDQTLRVLTMAGELINGALSEKDFPEPASVVVRAFQ